MKKCFVAYDCFNNNSEKCIECEHLQEMTYDHYQSLSDAKNEEKISNTKKLLSNNKLECKYELFCTSKLCQKCSRINMAGDGNTKYSDYLKIGCNERGAFHKLFPNVDLSDDLHNADGSWAFGRY